MNESRALIKILLTHVDQSQDLGFLGTLEIDQPLVTKGEECFLV